MNPSEQHDSQSPHISGEFPTDETNVPPALDATSLSLAIKTRKAEYTRQRSIRIKVGTWNVAALHGTEEDIGKWFVHREGMCEQLSGLQVEEIREQSREEGNIKVEEPKAVQHGQDGPRKSEDCIPPNFESEEVGLYALGLQEIVDVSSPAEALRPYVDPTPSKRWKAAVENALPTGYQLVADTQLVGLLLLIYAAPSVAESISSVSSTNVGTGMLGYMGNKGAVATRLILGETTSLVFVNCHLAAGSDKTSLERRNWDASQIFGRTKFDPIDLEKGLRDDPTENIGQGDFIFWFGDLNYRLDDIPGDSVRQVLARHTENEYDKTHKLTRKDSDASLSSSSSSSASSTKRKHRHSLHRRRKSQRASKSFPTVSDEDVDPHNDPASLQTTISSLLPHDQLRMQQGKGKAFHEGWREGDISFLPTYKYDVGSVARFDSSEKNRGPSWCDRILYRTRQDKLKHEILEKEAAEARKKDEEMQARGLDKAVADDSVLFDYDPEVDGADSVEEYDPDKDQPSDKASSISPLDVDDPVQLEYYVSHQGILSSDHKPLDAGFTLTFDSVIPQLKAKVYQEVVRELDKAENESRPGLTVVVDTAPGHHHGKAGEDPNAVDFGDVPFDVPLRRSLTIANTSGVPATFAIEKPNPEDRLALGTPSWINYEIDQHIGQVIENKKDKASSQEITLYPGELANVVITVHVHDIDHVRRFNSGEDKPEEILLLRVTSGRDHFIPVSGRWLPTCFGRSVDDLTRMPEAGARSLAATDTSGPPKSDTGVRISAPRELFRLTEAISELSERAVAEWSMTKAGSEEDASPPWVTEPHGIEWPFKPETWTLKEQEERSPLLASVREALDTNASLNSIFPPEVPSLHRLEILSETLLEFLRYLSDGIVTAPVWEGLDQQLLAREKAKAPPLSWEETQAWVLESLAYSPAHSVSFTFVTFMLARIVNEIAPASSARPPQSSRKSIEEPAPLTPQQTNENLPSTPPTPTSRISGSSLRRRARTLTSSSSSTPEIPQPNPAVARRQAVETALAGVFSKILIFNGPGPTKEKEKRALDERKRSVIEPFLKTFGVDSNGPSGGAL
ncbi:hypothetical protein ASPWEDRAFT_35108 [Aspergillus wentii DTO 134E9]|uniref:Inositol polyphosphate-related phosphatase domain-containing protein n=1 Tax=Aspergillus wentii DTO 134E9 TaxID=1073089 RepID=A0A1L9S307_ASPWE|nr:uncharacterized protein ASPWEDRAFT_35108 [Aspergillus wentii DTO 134E9]KAI9929890.1 hypothetical protein MW887_011698 [Aspergillus wentii]OJJ41541.1 hypothetical protein ASPWEDRAFT_35108 [Aspergillus wentii DTO 134E9]